MSRSFKLTIAYDGTDFAGWQVQPGEATIQGMLQLAMQKITGEQIQVIGSGRTDSGVHANGQVASCQLPWRDTADRLANALNANLPATIVVREAIDAPDGFHAIRDAVSKRYRYQLQLGGMRDAFQFRYRWHLHGTVDIDRIENAARFFVGKHDFESFQTSGSDRKTTTRNVFTCELIRESRTAGGGQNVSIEIEADGFLYNMVRAMVGTLVEVGRGRQEPEWIGELIAARNRDLAGQTAPAQGLFLQHVAYRGFAF